eukprot:comp3453_c0_seq1/m.1475 comp3453_c0_seq1/g.1475  ORF comp3453_c0_seq1/g.1475 comp3453_c0_seq1/m.1475 type:complete len:141 (+) comp3453_c0_seq1:24-446(+)
MSGGFLIDSANIYEMVGGFPAIERLSTNFYNRVFDDDDEEYYKIFTSMFINLDKANAIRNQAEFLTQRFGGPQLYSERKGHPALRMRHAPFAITEKAAQRWMEHMTAAVNEVFSGDEHDFVRRAMMEFFLDTAMMLVNSQ